MEGYVKAAGRQGGRAATRNSPHQPSGRLAVWPTFVLLVCLLPSTLGAQLAGRWRLSLESNRPMLAELVLDSSATSWQGRILLERPDSISIPLANLSVQSGIVRAQSASAGLQLELRHSGESLDGTLTLNRSSYAVAGIRLEPGDEFYPSPPAFVLRQLVVGSNQTHYRIPGRWLAAIQAAPGLSSDALRSGYVELALSAEFTPLAPDSFGSLGLYRAMGLYRRAETTRTAIRTLEQIRSGITGDTVRARFDYLFRPAGTWLVDIHDVAMALVKRAYPTVTWETARPALEAANLLSRNPSPDLETVPLALYGLFTLRQRDSLAFNATLAEMRAGDGESRSAVLVFLDAYESASSWYVTVLRFLMEQPVFDSGVSLAARVSKFWQSTESLPEIRAHSYGYPEGAARVGADSALVVRLIRPINATAREWGTRHRPVDLLAAVHRLPAAAGDTYLDLASQRFRVTSVGQASMESFSGFLEPRDQILLDPSYEPLLALGTLVHEWQHLIHEHRRASESLPPGDGGTARLTELHPYLAEGLAEWAAEQILAPLAERYPLLRFGEVEKRMSLADEDPHVLGYAMIRALNSAVGSPRATVSLLVQAGADPALVLRDGRVAAAWRRFSGPDRMVPRHGGIKVIPETRFELIDELPEVIETHLRIEGLGE